MRTGVLLCGSHTICPSVIVRLCMIITLFHITDSIWTKHDEKRIIFLQDEADAYLMYEFLSEGLVIGKNHTITLQDEELSSTRPAKTFHRIFNTRIPRTHSGITKTLAEVSNMGEVLEMDTFEQLLLASIFSAHRARHSTAESRQDWGQLFCHLVAAITYDLAQLKVLC
ncbi:protein FAM180A [Hypanus sabinus]|uniref:protein FAM180A n=1 Tax=Hypanus sabinus TaxID=79690 RepID=UPI0028C40A9D|nr:protein FAM180A [Hypanus sabinus]